MNGHVSEKTDSFAFGMVLLELLTGESPAATAELYTGQEDLFSHMEDKYKDQRAGKWPRSTVRAVAKVAKLCLAWQAQRRATVKDALPMMEAALKSAGIKI